MTRLNLCVYGTFFLFLRIPQENPFFKAQNNATRATALLNVSRFSAVIWWLSDSIPIPFSCVTSPLQWKCHLPFNFYLHTYGIVHNITFRITILASIQISLQLQRLGRTRTRLKIALQFSRMRLTFFSNCYPSRFPFLTAIFRACIRISLGVLGFSLQPLAFYGFQFLYEGAIKIKLS